MTRICSIVAVFTALVFNGFAPGALAKTPDGLTPAEEDVCSDLNGAAFGLCNAYCEAMDCDSPMPHAAARACQRVKQNFTKLTGSDKLPCDLSPCEQQCAQTRDLEAENCRASFDPDVLCTRNDRYCRAIILSDQENCIFFANEAFEVCSVSCSGQN